MRFNFLLAMALLLSSCSQSNTQSYSDSSQNKAIVGEPLKKSISTAQVDASFELPDGHVYLSDKDHAEILEFSGDPFKLIRRITLPEGYLDADFAIGKKAAYFLAARQGELVSVDSEGSVKSTVKFTTKAKVLGLTLNPEHGRAILNLDTGNILLFAIADDGKIENQWESGLLLDGEAEIASATIARDGTPIVALSDGQIWKIDFNKTLKKEEWIYDSINVAEDDLLKKEENAKALEKLRKGINWMIPTGDSEKSLLLGQAGIVIFVLDADAGIFTDLMQFDTAAKIAYGSAKVPHVFVQDWTAVVNNSARLLTVDGDGKLTNGYVSNRYIGANKNGESYVLSYLSKDAKTVSLISNSKTPRIVKLRIKDGLVSADTNVVKDRNFALLDDGYICLRKSEAGYAEKFPLTDESDRIVIFGFRL